MTQGTALALAPLISWPVLAPILALALALVVYALIRRARGAWWRLLGFAALALALINPSLVSERREPVRDVAAVVVDQSPSQALGARAARTERALEDLQTRLGAMPDLDVRVVRAGAAADGPGAGAVTETRLFDALDRAMADVPRRQRAGAILITDGQVHDVPTDPAAAKAYGPVHTLLSGEHDEADRRLEIVEAPSFGLVGKPVTLKYRVDDLPGPQAASAQVTISQDGGPPQRLSVPVGQDMTLEVTLAHAGPNVVELAAEPAPRELTLANNRAGVVINAVRDRLRVLLVSGEPYTGERTWRNILKADPAVDLVHFTILRPPEKQDGTPVRELSLIAFPIRELFEVKLSEFDLVIFDRYRQRGVLPQAYLDNIARYVTRGGALLEAGGAGLGAPLGLRGTPLGGVLPGEPSGGVIDQPFKPTVTGLGRRHPVTAGLPGDDPAGGPPAWGRWFHQSDLAAVRGTVVMTGADGRPLLILDRVGEGRVAQLASDQIWLWSRGFEGGGPQAELLRRLAHWLMKEPELEENDLRAMVEGNRITIERRSLQPDARSVQLVSPSDVVRTVVLKDDPAGLARAVVVAPEPGLYRLSDGERQTVALVGAANMPELADMRTTPDRLAGVARATGGGILWLADLEHQPGGLVLRRPRPDRDQSGPGWIGLRANGAYLVSGVTDTPLVPLVPLLVLVLGALLAAWRREGT
jgi:hypothetical protein